MDENSTILTVYVGEKEGQHYYLSRDIRDISAEVFNEWVSSVYPGGLPDIDMETLEDEHSRKVIFDGILGFWSLWHKSGTEQAKEKK